jgi:hypothetical protein
MITPGDKKIALKIGLVLAGVHLAFSLFIWNALCRGENGEGWLFVGLLHLPTIWLGSWLFPGLPSVLAGLSQPLVFCGFGTILWFIFGWTMTRIVALYG